MVLMKIATRKLTRLRWLLQSLIMSIEYVIVIAVFLVLSCSNLVMDQELQKDEYEDTKQE